MKITWCDRLGLQTPLNGAAVIEAVAATSLTLRTFDLRSVELVWSGPSLASELAVGDTVEVTVAAA